MDIGEILSKAWKTIWKHKILWLFGVLAGCMTTNAGGGGGGGGGNAVYSGEQSSSWAGPNLFTPFTQRMSQDFLARLSEIPVLVWILIAVILVLGLIVMSFLCLLAGTLGTAGVIKGTSLADEADPDRRPLSFGEIFKAIKSYYWKVFLLNLGLRFLGLFLGLILAVPIALLIVCTCFMGLFLLIPIGWFIDVMITFTTIAIIDEEKGILDGIKRAWQVISSNLGSVALMFLVLGIGQLIIGLIIGLPLIATPLPILINLFMTDFRSVAIGLIVSIILFLAFIPLIIFLGGILKAYVLSSWTLTYRRLTALIGLEPIVLSEEPKEEDAA